MADITDARGEFPATGNWTYLDSSSTGLMPLETRAAVSRFLDDCVQNGTTRSDWVAGNEAGRAAFATLINARPEDICFTKNATDGINHIAAGLAPGEGENVVCAADLEHPANIFPWLNLRSRGVDVRIVPPTAQAIDVDALIGACDGNTRAVAVSSVTFVPGFRTDLERLGAHCRANDIFLMIDATQSAGVLQTDVASLPIDGLATSTHKYLLSFYGQGFLWCRPEWAGRLLPSQLGKPAVLDEEGHPGQDGYLYELKDDARRFETGHLYVGGWALAASIGRLLDYGPAAIEAHVTGLAAELRARLAALGLAVNSDPFDQGPTQIVTVGELTGGLYEFADPALAAIHERLKAAKVRHSARRNTLRFSFHLYNDESDIERVVEVAGAALKDAA